MAAATRSHHTTLKLLMLGDSSVGKSCLTQRFTQGKSASMALGTTMGVDLTAKTVTLEGTTVRLQIWDTAGQEKFRSLAANYYRGAQGVCLVYDITRRDSFTSISHWLECIKEHGLDCAIILIGNKSDLEARRAVSTADGRALAARQHVPFFETSAMTDLHVTDAFMTLARATYAKVFGGDEGSGAGARPGPTRAPLRADGGRGSTGGSTVVLSPRAGEPATPATERSSCPC